MSRKKIEQLEKEILKNGDFKKTNVGQVESQKGYGAEIFIFILFFLNSRKLIEISNVLSEEVRTELDNKKIDEFTISISLFTDLIFKLEDGLFNFVESKYSKNSTGYDVKQYRKLMKVIEMTKLDDYKYYWLRTRANTWKEKKLNKNSDNENFMYSEILTNSEVGVEFNDINLNNKDSDFDIVDFASFIEEIDKTVSRSFLMKYRFKERFGVSIDKIIKGNTRAGIRPTMNIIDLFDIYRNEKLLLDIKKIDNLYSLHQNKDEYLAEWKLKLDEEVNGNIHFKNLFDESGKTRKQLYQYCFLRFMRKVKLSDNESMDDIFNEFWKYEIESMFEYLFKDKDKKETFKKSIYKIITSTLNNKKKEVKNEN